ncbi:MAG: tRNA (adenosine(37)-N6)-threonylcarbamoyltransferase complex ATPase subunit type 1 TsaE [Desulfonauticus sp.]|nr:tRNA (adenosine(37)-N6)-threonylcarbamoyltransferase complex ATPase subunit type 1 TsaE [Desulfonauticus sp.]
MVNFVLSSLSDTKNLAQSLARLIIKTKPFPKILFQGALGTGKTTFIRFLVETLPGSEQAEISSPSFNLVNIYPTTPEVAHFDLYRLNTSGWDESLEELLFDQQKIVLVEWSEFLPPHLELKHTLNIKIILQEQKRNVEIRATEKEKTIISLLKTRGLHQKLI